MTTDFYLLLWLHSGYPLSSPQSNINTLFIQIRLRLFHQLYLCILFSLVAMLFPFYLVCQTLISQNSALFIFFLVRIYFNLKKGSVTTPLRHDNILNLPLYSTSQLYSNMLTSLQSLQLLSFLRTPLSWYRGTRQTCINKSYLTLMYQWKTYKYINIYKISQ